MAVALALSLIVAGFSTSYGTVLRSALKLIKEDTAAA